MCSDYRLLERVPADMLFPFLLAPEGMPNFEPREDWARWLDPDIPSAALLKPLPAGSFEIVQVN